MSREETEAYYDAFSARFVRDYVEGNERVARQLAFFAEGLPAATQRVLVVGCGSGESAHFVATRVAPAAQVLGVDLSGEAIALARRLLPHPRVEYRQADVISEPPAGPFDAVLLPDVYEHIPVAARGALHAALDDALAPAGRVLVTVPTPAYQALLRAEGGAGLQIVDEDVGLPELLRLADDLRGELTYYRRISVWRRDDYAHALIERGAAPCGPIEADASALEAGPRREGLLAGLRWRAERKLRRVVRQARVRRRLGDDA